MTNVLKTQPQNKETWWQMQKNGKEVKAVHGHTKKLLNNLGRTSRFCECGKLFTFKVRTTGYRDPYIYFEKCQLCRGLQVKKSEQKLFCVYKSKPKTIPNKPNKKRVPRRDAEIKICTRVREEAKSDPRGLHLF